MKYMIYAFLTILENYRNYILINLEGTHRGMHGRTDGRTDKPKAICPFNFSKIGGIKTQTIKNDR